MPEPVFRTEAHQSVVALLRLLFFVLHHQQPFVFADMPQPVAERLVGVLFEVLRHGRIPAQQFGVEVVEQEHPP